MVEWRRAERARCGVGGGRGALRWGGRGVGGWRGGARRRGGRWGKGG